MDTKRFETLKQQAIITLYELDKLTGGDIVHQRNGYCFFIRLKIKQLERDGETVAYFRNSRLPRDLDALEQLLTKTNIWITKIKLRGRKP